MKFIITILSLLLGACLLGAEPPRALYPLTSNAVFPPEYQKAALAVIAAISEQGLKPREYSAEVTLLEGGKTLEFSLWHDSALPQREHPTVRGDPTGKCRTVVYDVPNAKVIKIHGWR